MIWCRLASSKKDHERCAQIFLESRRAGFTWLPPETFKLEDYAEATVDEEVWVAVRRSEIIGFASIYLPADFLHNLFVLPSEQNKGVGAKLLERFLARTKRPAMLKCLQANQKALQFYLKKGWQRMEPEEGELGPCWVMIKR